MRDSLLHRGKAGVLVLACCLAPWMFCVPQAGAAPSAYEAEAGSALEEAAPADSAPSDDQSSRTEPSGTDKASSARKEEAGRQRYEVILENENGFTYYVDMQNARWIRRPYSASEYIADVWVLLVRTEDRKSIKALNPKLPGSLDDPVYYMEHYYLRPDKEQIQFLCELEVTGRPQNAIRERAYDYQHWENLIPGSIEDEIFHRVLVLMKGKPRYGENPTLWDYMDEYLRISL